MIIQKKKISINNKPFIIAEFSGNHNQNLKILKKMVLQLKKQVFSNQVTNLYPGHNDFKFI